MEYREGVIVSGGQNEVRESASIYPACKTSKVISNQKIISVQPPQKTSYEKFESKKPGQPLIPTPDRTNVEEATYSWKKPRLPTEPTMVLSPSTTRRQISRNPVVSTTRSILPKRTTKPPNQLRWTPIKTKNTTAKAADKNKATRYEMDDGDSDPYWEGDFLAEEKNQLILEQTKRILHMHINFLLNQKKLMEIDKEEFLYLRIAKNILLKTCPELEVPKALLNSLLRLFRFLLYESIEVYPYAAELTTQDEDARISNSLVNCFESAERMTFKYEEKGCGPKVLSHLFIHISSPGK
jgi:hypothetical protein